MELFGGKTRVADDCVYAQLPAPEDRDDREIRRQKRPANEELCQTNQLHLEMSGGLDVAG